MKLRKKLEKKLAMEFVTIRPDILKVVTDIVVRDMEGKPVDEVLQQVFNGNSPEIADKEEKIRLIEQILLTCAKNMCTNSDAIKNIKQAIDSSVEEVRSKQKRYQASNISHSLKVGPRCSIFRAAEAASIDDRPVSQSSVEEEKMGEKKRKR